MTKKSKNRYQSQSRHQPSAPTIDNPAHHSQSAFSQPPNNPYYPDLESSSSLLPPPPYSDLSTRISQPSNFVPMNRVDSSASANYPILPAQDAGPTIIVHRCDVGEEVRHAKVRKFNNELGIAALIVIIVSVYARSLYDSRSCPNYLVHSVNSDAKVMFTDVRDAHLHVACFTVVLLLLSMAKCSAGQSKGYSCYLVLVSLVSLIGTILTGYLAYLAFYSPCTNKIGDVASNMIKTVAGSFVNSMPSPDKGVFGESNVYDHIKDDPNGHYIFMIDLFNFFIYASSLLTSFAFC